MNLWGRGPLHLPVSQEQTAPGKRFILVWSVGRADVLVLTIASVIRLFITWCPDAGVNVACGCKSNNGSWRSAMHTRARQPHDREMCHCSAAGSLFYSSLPGLASS